jgi:RNA polymerase sigma factor (TIGR02999 family)
MLFAAARVCSTLDKRRNMTPSTQQVSQLLMAWREGDAGAFDKLMPMVYDELRRLAHRYMRRVPAGQTLQTTALVHEAYLRLAGHGEVDWQSRVHFFAVCAQVMRGLLVDRARSRYAIKRGGGLQQVELNDAALQGPSQDEQLLILDDALERLSAIDPRKTRIVEMRYFGGMSVEETAQALNLSPITIKREWSKARAWLYREMQQTEQ